MNHIKIAISIVRNGLSVRVIFFKRSTDEGASFYGTENLSNNGGESGQPDIAASGNNVYVVGNDDAGIPTGDCDTTADNRDVFLGQVTIKEHDLVAL
jgi:hypothetical protein